MSHAQKPLTITVGIPTCYGGQSLVETVQSIRRAKEGETVRILITADRTPITSDVHRSLTSLGAELTWNKTEGSQTKKVKQMVAKVITDIYISTQDDVTFDEGTITEIRNAFTQDTKLTMAGIRILPLTPVTKFEAAMGVMVRVVDGVARSWNNTDNHLAASGRCLAFRANHLKRFRIPEALINSDMFYYLENKQLGGMFRQLADVYVFIRCPQTLKDQIAPSSRYLYSKKEMEKYFSSDLSEEYRIPKTLVAASFLRELLAAPVPSLYYLFIRIYTFFHRQPEKKVANPVWDVDASTKSSALNTHEIR